MKNFSVLAIRDFETRPAFAKNWRGSYFLEPCETLQGAIRAALIERDERGGKYGFVFYENGYEIGAVNYGSVGGFIPRSEY